MSVANNSLVTPGDVLGSAAEYQCGENVHVAGEFVVASVVGRAKVGGLSLGVVPSSPVALVVPSVDDIVTIRITRLTPRLASGDILLINNQVVKEKLNGVIRARDVRSYEIDSVSIPASFHPGDLVRASVVSLGDSRSYFLSTARNDFGVLEAYSSNSGSRMVPISWTEMKCPKTGIVEQRKVAKFAGLEDTFSNTETMDTQ